MDFDAKAIRKLAKAMREASRPIEIENHYVWVPGYGFLREATDLKAAMQDNEALRIFVEDVEKG